METTNVWHQRHLSGLKISFLLLGMLLTAQFAAAQMNINQRRENLPDYDSRFITYGFTLGGHTTTLRPEFSNAFTGGFSDTLNILPSNAFGFSIGFLGNFHVAQYLDIRIMPKVAFYDYRLSFETLSNSETTKDVAAEFTTVDVPLSLKFKSQRRGNYRMFFTGGVTPTVDVTGKKKSEENMENGLQLKGNNLTADVGFGADIYFPFFKFSPEIRYSYGLMDVLENRDNRLGRAFDRLGTHTIGFYLVFN